MKISCFVLMLVHLAQSAPKQSKTQATYDQKQTGEYNIQLHLKDFQIIAVVGEDSLGSLSGDYDYDYDYADFTIKPVVPSTTKKPDNDTASTTNLSTTTKKTYAHPYPIETTIKPNLTSVKPTAAVEILSTVQVNPKPTSESLNVAENTSEIVVTSPRVLPGQIPVIVQDYSENNGYLKDGVDKDKKNEAVTNIAIVPSEDMGIDQQEQPTLGEILHYRRCAQGYSRDKRGRCRKVRRPQPQIPLGITRFANLAAKFRQATSPENMESIESSLEN